MSGCDFQSLGRRNRPKAHRRCSGQVRRAGDAGSRRAPCPCSTAACSAIRFGCSRYELRVRRDSLAMYRASSPIGPGPSIPPHSPSSRSQSLDLSGACILGPAALSSPCPRPRAIGDHRSRPLPPWGFVSRTRPHYAAPLEGAPTPVDTPIAPGLTSGCPSVPNVRSHEGRHADAEDLVPEGCPLRHSYLPAPLRLESG